MSLLSNPVIQGLLGGGGPNAIRAQYDQQRAAMAPRGGGGMMGAPSPIVTQDRSMSELGSGLSGLGEGLASIGKARRAAAQKEAEDTAIQTYLDGIPPGPQRDQIAAMAAVPRGREILMAGLAKQSFPDAEKPVALGAGQVLVNPTTGKQVAAGPEKPGEWVNIINPKTGDMQPHQKGNPIPAGFVLGGPYTPNKGDPLKPVTIGEGQILVDPTTGRQIAAGPSKAQTPDKIKLWFGDKSVDATAGSKTEEYYLGLGYKKVPALSEPGPNTKEIFASEDGMRKEYTKLTDDFATVQNAFQNIKKAADAANGPGDISLLTGYMKMLDPGSTVREGEFATAENAQGVPAQVRTQWNKLMSGERLAPETRAQFVKMADSIYTARADEYRQVGQQFTRIAKQRGYNPDSIVYDRERGIEPAGAGQVAVTPPAPDGVDPAVWAVMTPEERALFP